MGMSRRLFMTAGAAWPLAAAATWSLAAAAAEPGAPAPVAPTGVHFGALLPLSGPDGLVGDECLRGVMMALDDINAAGGIAGKPASLALIDAYVQAQSAQAAQAAMAADRTAFLLGSGSSGFSYPGSAAAELAQLPYIELSAAADGITGRGFRFLLRTTVTTSMIASVAVAAMAARYPGRKIGLLFNTGAEAGAVAAAALALWGQAKTPVRLSIGYGETVLDLRAQAGRMQRAGVEVLLHAAGADDVLQLFTAMRDIGWRPAAIFGCGPGYGLRESALALGPALEGTFVAGAPFYPVRAQYLADAYQERFDMQPRSADSLSCYVGAKLVLDILDQTGGDSTKLLESLRRVNIPTGTLANGWGVAFDRNGQNQLAFANLQQWQSGVLKTLS
jgi:branched-chain amino acid transport system substrate-binding protein